MEARAAKKRLRRRLLQVRGVTVRGLTDVLGAAESEGHMDGSRCSRSQFQRDLGELGAAIEGEENRGRAIVVLISSLTCAHMQGPRVRQMPEVRLRKRVSFYIYNSSPSEARWQIDVRLARGRPCENVKMVGRELP